MSDIQKARDYANQQQFTAENQQFINNYNYSIEGEDARSYLVQLFTENFPKLHNDAMQVAIKCAEELAIAVLAEIHKIDPSRISNLARPGAQATLLAAQQSYAKTADPETGAGDMVLGRVLAKLVAESTVEGIRSTKEIVLQRAVDIVVHLSNKQINSLSVLAVLTQLNWHGDDPVTIVTAIDGFLCSYYGEIVTNGLEYSYMGSTGVGQILFGKPIYQQIRDNHRFAMRKSFSIDAVPEFMDADMRSVYLEEDPRSPGMYRLREEIVTELLGSRKNFLEAAVAALTGDVAHKLQAFAESQIVSPEELKDIIATNTPRLFDFLEQLDAVSAMNFQLSTVGFALASQELSLRFPGTDFFGSMLSLDATKPPENATENPPQAL